MSNHSNHSKATSDEKPRFISPAAVYRPQLVNGYRGNPCNEALPDIPDALSLAERLSSYPPYREEDRYQPDCLRLHIIWDTLQDLFICDDRHANLATQVGLLLRAGYKGRNPARPGYWGALAKTLETFDSLGGTSLPSAKALGLVGISGGGKSTTLQRIFNQYSPQVLRHTWYEGKPLILDQLVWLKLECPSDGSTKGLCNNFLNAVDGLLGTHYQHDFGGSRRTKYELFPAMARIAAIHCLGLLAVDEIQVLSESKSGGAEEMLNFFVELINTIGVPIILVGTYQATPVLSGKFRQARRVSGYGDCVWRPMKEDEEWQFFIEALWKYTYVRKPVPLTPQLSHALYEETQGIADLAVKVYALAQWRAITSGVESVTEPIIRSVALDSLQLSRMLINALKAGDDEQVRRIGDISPIGMDDLLQQELMRPRTTPAQAGLGPEGMQTSGAAGEKAAVHRDMECEGASGSDAATQESLDGLGSESDAGNSVNKLVRHQRSPRIGGVRANYAPGTLMALAKKSESLRSEQTLYDTLQGAGVMRPVEEFLIAGGLL